jgi:2-iminobutanoate/2-iminopropanoate deaminase
MKKAINTSHAPAPIGPYNQSIAAGGLLFVSGQIPIDPTTGELIKGTIEDETTRVLRNIGAILHEVGLGFGDVVKSSVFVKNMDDFGRINQVYAGFFDGTIAPARELIQAVRLPRDANIEISVIAVMKQ